MTRSSSGLPTSVPTGSPGRPLATSRPRRRVLVPVLLLMAALLGFDLAQPPQGQLTAHLLAGVVRFYQESVPATRPWRGHCRMSPTCSVYAIRVLHDHGALRGGWLTFRRLLRCGPWTPRRTKDPPPPAPGPGPRIEAGRPWPTR